MFIQFKTEINLPKYKFKSYSTSINNKCETYSNCEYKMLKSLGKAGLDLANDPKIFLILLMQYSLRTAQVLVIFYLTKQMLSVIFSYFLPFLPFNLFPTEG